MNIESDTSERTKLIEREIPKEFFDDPSNKFLYDAAVHELSAENLTPEMEEFINKYLDLLVTDPEKEQDDDHESKYEKFVDHDKTELLISKLDEFLKTEREKIGISPDTEKPFSVRVLGLKSDDYIDQEDEWIKMTSRPSMFAHRTVSASNDIKNSTIYLSTKDLEKMIFDDGWEEFARSTFRHEYRHSQRVFSYGDGHLYRFVDEVCTNAGHYIEITTALDILCASTEDLSFKDFMDAYESDNKEVKMECLRKFKENFGSYGLMLMGGKRSSNHSGDSDGIENLPYLKKYENENLSFFETMLAILEERTSGKWLETLSEKIKDPDLFTRQNLEIIRNHGLYGYCNGIDGTDAVFTKKVFDLLDKEIEARKSRGEKGWGE